ncbi:MAG: molybdenum cofactor guanylyltransferase [Cyanobacteria bacterium P01_G01_bin.38]
MAQAISALILAGGYSTRMGQDKALLTLGDKPLLQRICETALACTPNTFVVTPWPSRYQAVIPFPAQLLRETVIETAAHRQPSPGPLVGFAQGLRQLNQRGVKADWVLLLACDLPGLEVAVLRQWQAQLATLPAAAIAALPRSPKGWEPLCGFYRRTVLANLEGAIEQGTRSFQRWLATASMAPSITPLTAPSSMLVNCNTPEQWQQVLRQQALQNFEAPPET